ncbi:MAG: choice-of-anchor B family protein [Crocinitomicaceae bacterium]
MFKVSLIIILFFSINASIAQLNIDSISHIDYNVLHATELNDVWGYEDELGNEYALVGARKGTSVVDISIPSNPIEVFWEPGMESTWRDLKTNGDYAYITTEASNGLLIIDLSTLPASTILTTNYYTGPVGQNWESAHNLYIDEFGYAYIFGANRGNGGVIILDIFTDPMNPIEVGVFDDWYVHDGFVQNDTMYLAHISDGFFSIVDISDRGNPVLLGTKTTPSNFSHNIWASADGKYVYTTDEVSGGYIGAYDVTDPANIIELDRVQSSPGAFVIPHNTHVLGNHIVTSYYSDGVVIHDITYPYNMIEVGSYDTYPQQTISYDGCWGAYPFFTSGLILATDITEGLFILSPTYVQAAYLEGIVTDANTTNPIDQVVIEISGNNQTELTQNTGFYATGIAAAGSYNVTYSKVGYFPQTIAVSLATGVITNQNLQLVPIPPYNFDITVLEEGTGTPISNVQIKLIHPLITHNGITNGIGEESLTLFYEDNYQIQVGKWGYFTHCSSQIIDNTTGQITISIKKMIYDDFTFDFGWTVAGTATKGIWERGLPNGTDSGSAPFGDVSNDCGDFAFVTGNAPQPNPDVDDVDKGTTNLISPVIDLSGFADPYVNYTRWFYSFYGPADSDDTLRVVVSNGIQTVEIEKVGGGIFIPNGWIEKSFRISDFITLTSTMQFFFNTSDEDPNVNITEAAIDKFFIIESFDLGVEQLENEIKVYPNPVQNQLTVKTKILNAPYRMLSMEGAEVKKGVLTTELKSIGVSDLKSGVYFLSIADKVYKVIKID